MTVEEVRARLKDRTEYYNGLGKHYLSNSNIGVLLSDPAALGTQKEYTHFMQQGSMFHEAIEEELTGEDLMSQYKIVDEKRDLIEFEEGIATKFEYDTAMKMKDAVLSNRSVQALLEGNYEIESVGIGTIYNQRFKCRFDLINFDKRVIVDWKKTSSLSSFVKSSFDKYNYDSATYIYKTLAEQTFGMPFEMMFVAVCPKTFKTRIYIPPDYVMNNGKGKAAQAIKNYKMFHGS